MNRRVNNYPVPRLIFSVPRNDVDPLRRVRFQPNQKRMGKGKPPNFKPPNFSRFQFGADEFMGDNNMGPVQVVRFHGCPGGRGRNRDRVGPGVASAAFKRPYWYEIVVVNGARYGREDVLNGLMNHLNPQKIYPICYQIVRSDSHFFVEKYQTAQLVLSCTRKVSMNDGQSLVLKLKEGRPPVTPIDDLAITRIKTVMGKRFVAENKALNLSYFVRDPDFVDGFFCSLSRPPVFQAVMKIINENIPDLVAINLTGNALREFDHIANEMKKLKNLKIIHLGENSITNLNQLNCLKDVPILELVLEKNPVMSMFPERAHFIRYDYHLPIGVTIMVSACRCQSSSESSSVHSEVRKRFPKIIKLDDTMLEPAVTFDVADESVMPEAQAAFISAPQGRDFVKVFLSQYYQIFDSDKRLDLAQAYSENAVFSITAAYPAVVNTNNSPRLNAYFSESRNLLRINDFSRRKNKLRVGKTEIVEFLFKQVPKSQHDLASFVVDLPFFTPDLISLSVSGLFRETGVGSPSNWPLRSFSRTFLIVPVGSGFCITNDMLYVTNATEEQVEIAFKVIPDTGVSSPGAGAVSPAAAVVSPSVASPVVVDDAMKLQMVHTVAQQTGMNLDWSRKCLEETEWNLERAAIAFNELRSRNAIPPEAFVK